MSYSLKFTSPDGGNEVFSLCGVGTWTRFIEWVHVLDAGFDSLQALVRDGEVKGSLQLSNDLLKAQLSNPPGETSAAASVLNTLLELVGVGDDDETVYVSQD